MAITDENSNGFYMPVAPAYGGGNQNNGSGFFGGDWMAWIILLLLIGNGGWGMGGFGMGGMMWPLMMGGFGMGGYGLEYLYPWLNNSQQISGGFQNQQLSNQLSGISDRISSGFSDVQLGQAGINQNICQTGNAIIGAVNNGFSAAEASANNRQMANMQQQFNNQTAMMQGFNSMGQQFANCCCENRLGIAGLNSTIISENCADREALNNVGRDLAAQAVGNTNALLNAVNNGVQSIKDQLCNDKLDAKNDEISQLRQRLYMADLAASQAAQTATIQQGFTNNVNDIYNRLSQCPVGTVPVYGNQPIFTCSRNFANNGNGGCGCNGNVNFA